MNWLDRQIAKIFPGHGLENGPWPETAWTGSRKPGPPGAPSRRCPGPGHPGRGMLSSFQSPDAAVKNDIAGLRAQVRHLEFNNGFVSGPIRRIVNNVVGTGNPVPGKG